MVIGRKLETAILHFLEGRALARGATGMRGEYLPTAKNGPCRDFYPHHGYTCVAPDGERTEWRKDLKELRTAILALEERFGVSFDAEEIPELVSVRGISEALDRRGALLG